MTQSYKLGPWNKGRKMVKAKEYQRGSKKITYDKVWNRGISSDAIDKVVLGVDKLIEKENWDLIVYTYDYLDPDNLGVFPLDGKAWSDEEKEITFVPYGEFLSITVGNPGAEINRKLAFHPRCLEHGSGKFTVNGKQVLCFRKRVDDAFDSARDESLHTLNVDLDDQGHVNKEGKTLLEQLAGLGYPPDETELTFTGVVTNRCVQSSLNHACKEGYSIVFDGSGTAAASNDEHEEGKRDIFRGCPQTKVTAGL